MPRKSKITAVPVEQASEVQAGEVSEEKTEAEHMTDVINEVKEEAPVEEKEAEALAVPAAKPKAKRSPAKKKEVQEPEGALTPSEVVEALKEEEPVAAPAEGGGKSADKVTCPDCGKQMSAKTLKYSHVPNCTAKKSTRESAPHTQITDDMIEYEIEQRLTNRRAERAVRRQEMVAKLMQNAF
jgi:hypothetical protein